MEKEIGGGDCGRMVVCCVLVQKQKMIKMRFDFLSSIESVLGTGFTK